MVKIIFSSFYLYFISLFLPSFSIAQDANYAQYTNSTILNINYDLCLNKVAKTVGKIILDHPKIERDVIYIFTENNNVAIQIICLKNKKKSFVSIHSVGVESGVLSVYSLHNKIFTSIKNELGNNFN